MFYTILKSIYFKNKLRSKSLIQSKSTHNDIDLDDKWLHLISLRTTKMHKLYTNSVHTP